MSDRVMKAAILCASLFVCGPIAFAADGLEAADTVVLESPVMKASGPIPLDHTQHGWDFSPPLTWKNLPEGTKELALIFEGPVSAKPRPFVHWVVYNIPATAKGLPEELPMEATIEAPKELAGLVQGHTGWGDPGYRGPWPIRAPDPNYRFKLYAIDADLDLKPGLDKTGLLKAIEGHVIGTGELVVVCEPRRRPRTQRSAGP